MTYKKNQKIKKQKKTRHLIPPELIAGRHFQKVIALAQDKAELTQQDRYLYGYSLLKMKDPIQALITLWPLASKNQTPLLDDCATIMQHAFREDGIVSTEALSEDSLQTLFLAAHSMAPNRPWAFTLKQALFDRLWNKGHYERLERILKLIKHKKSIFMVENLGKLAFFQAKSKLAGSLPAFIGHVLTGGACLILQHPIYHANIAEEMHSLGHEIKLLLTALQTTGSQQLAWNKRLIEDFIDYEASVLIEILQQRISLGDSDLEIIPSPSYLLAYDGINGPLSQTFLPWLSKHRQDLVQLYQVHMQQLVLWALDGEKLSLIKEILSSLKERALHPYLRLAIMLRAEAIKKSSSPVLVEINELKKWTGTLPIFKKIAIHTAKSIINTSLATPDFWKMLGKFSSVLDDEELQQAILSKKLTLPHELSKTSVLLQMNPFSILGVSHTDSKPMMMKKMMELMRQSPDKMAVLRQAQSEMFNLSTRFLHHYLRFMNHENHPMDLMENMKHSEDICALDDIPLRQEFYHVES